MEFKETSLKGAFIIELRPFRDNRGVFARTFCANEFAAHGLRHNMVQSNLSITYKKNTIRGMHYQVNGAEEAKLIRCVRGRVLDAIIDIRPNSETFGRHIMLELDSKSSCLQLLYVPENFAHGFLTLKDKCEVLYQVSNFYSPGKERGIRWSDPFFGIPWPTDNPIVSDKDANYPDFRIDK